MINNFIKFTLLSTAIVLVGCDGTLLKTTVEQPEETPTITPAPEVVEKSSYLPCETACSDEEINANIDFWLESNDSLGFYQWFNVALPQNNKLIYKQLTAKHAEMAEDPIANLYLSLILSHPDTKYRDTAKAIFHVNKFQKNSLQKDRNYQFSLFISRQLRDRRNMVSQRFKLRERNIQLEHELTEAQKNNAATKNQLEQLKTIEKSLLKQQSQETKKYRVVK